MNGLVSHLTAELACGCRVPFEMPDEPQGAFWRAYGTCQDHADRYPHGWQLTVTVIPVRHRPELDEVAL